MTSLEIKNLNFHYKKNQPLLCDLSFKIETGEFIGLVGLNGSGKTTLLKIIVGILKPLSGEVLINEEKINGITKTRILVNIVPENSKLFLVGPTVIEDLTKIIGNKTKALSILEQFHLEDLAEKKLYRLSEGQRRLIAIFNSLHQDKEVFILDELTIGLDKEGITLVLSLIENLTKSGKIIIIATNDVRILPYFSRIIGIHKTKKVIDGAPNIVLFSLKEKIDIYPNQITRMVAGLKSQVDIPDVVTYTELNNFIKNKHI